MQWPGETVLTRVIEALETGVGGALRPWQTRRVERANAEARMFERLLLEQAELDIADIRAGRKRIDASGKLVACETPRPLLIERGATSDADAEEYTALSVRDFATAALDGAQAQEMQRAVNLKRVALYAEEEAEALDRREAEPRRTEEPPPKIDPDWFTRWRSGAEEVSREEMQRIWGKLLAGEVSRPGTYSLNTVSFLSRMSSKDADLIARVAPFVTSGGIVKLNVGFFAEKGIHFDDLLHLEEMGFINGTIGLGGLEYSLGTSDHDENPYSTLLCNEVVLLFYTGAIIKDGKVLKFPIYRITRAAREILSLASFQADEEYLKAIADLAVKLGSGEVQRGMLHPDGRTIVHRRTLARKEAQPTT